MTLFSSSSRRATASVVTGMTLAGAAAAFAAPAQAASVETWDAIASCESTNRWDINTGNGFYGGLQFTLSSWKAVGGEGYPHHASKAEQIKRAEKLQDLQGWGAWPVCSKKLGLSGADNAPDAYAAAPAAKVERQSTTDWAAEKRAEEERAAERAEAQRAAAAAKVSQTELAAAEKANKKNAAELDRAEDTLFVKPGDSLWKLAKKHDVQGGWQALYEANQDIIDDPTLIYIGQELVLPTA